MKKIIILLIIALGFTGISKAQEKTNVISLAQTPGKFTQKAITVDAGTYVFEIANNDAAPEVGFVLVPKGKDVSNPENHIKTAYVKEVVKKGTTGKTNVTTLTKGEYVYFCPLNKTAMNTLIVE